jgi:Zn-dependent protease with chaperone function
MFIAVGVVISAFLCSYAVRPELRPQAAARLITAFTVAAAAGAVWTITLIAGLSLAQVHGVAERLSFCHAVLTNHSDTLGVVGYVTVFMLCVAALSAARIAIQRRRLRAPRGAPDLAVLPIDEPTAYTRPGSPGQIVLSTGLLRSLEPAERRVVLAHERAHLECRHDRYVRATQFAVAVFPVVAPLARRVRFATERWADEVAAKHVGDRELVARAVAHAALLQPTAPVALGMASGGVVARVEALLRPAPERAPLIEYALTASALATALVLAVSVVDVHTWIAALFGLCH